MWFENSENFGESVGMISQTESQNVLELYEGDDDNPTML